MLQDTLSTQMLLAIESELRMAIDKVDEPKLIGYHQMLAYHMGWEGEGAGPDATGKRIRPLLLLLTASAAGGEWVCALPAAASVELVHNFSLIHDDIQDNSAMRRGRPTLWSKWGMPLAINAGDAMYTLAYISLLRLAETSDRTKTLQAVHILQQACLELTKGQHRDISYEKSDDLTLDDYWPMVRGKTAALLAACTELGALTAGTDPSIQEAYKEFGINLGMAFQALDDLLGIWGDIDLTGKSTDSDLISGKKSLPVLYSLELDGAFADRWKQGPIEPSEVQLLANQLEIDGARDYTQETAACYTDKAIQAINRAKPSGNAGRELIELASKLLKRKL